MVTAAPGNNTEKCHPHGFVLPARSPKGQVEGHQGTAAQRRWHQTSFEKCTMEKALTEAVTASEVGLRWQVGKTPTLPGWGPVPSPLPGPGGLAGLGRAVNSPTVAREMRILLKWPDVSELRASSRDL